MEIFGFEIKRKQAGKEETFAVDHKSDGVDLVIHDEIGTDVSGISSYNIDINGLPTEEATLISTYRSIAESSEVDEALGEIRNEVFTFDVEGKKAFDIAFFEEDEDKKLAENIKAAIVDAVDEVYALLDFGHRGETIFNRWYVDGKIYAHMVIDEANKRNGIKNCVIIDPLKIRKIRLLPKKKRNGVYDMNDVQDFYIFSDSFDKTFKPGLVNVVNYGTQVPGIRITQDAIAHCDSGLVDMSTGLVSGYLKKAILPYNNLRVMEDAMLIFRVVRAPQRRAIYIDVGGMQKTKADEYMKNIQSRFKNKMVYDMKTGSLSDRRNVMSMLEDYWLPRRDGAATTEIQNLEGQDSANTLQEVMYYRDKLWRALNVPISRFGNEGQPATPFFFGKGQQIERDEFRFKKFLNKIRRRFMMFFEEILKTQLILKNVIKPEDWKSIKNKFFWIFAEDNAYVEYKESEILNNKLNTLAMIDPFVGKYFSIEYVKANVIKYPEKDMKRIDKEIEDSKQKMLKDQVDAAALTPGEQ